MASDIATQTLKEHNKLISTNIKLIATLRKLPNDVRWGNSIWYQDKQYLDFVRIQTLSLQNIMKSVLQGYYRNSYHLIRMVFEGYFTLRLISTCDKYPIRVKIKKGEKDPTFADAGNKLIKQAQKVFGSHLLRTYMENSNTLVAVVRGRPVVDDKKEETGVTIPYYYGAWHEFRPVEYHLKRRGVTKKYSTLRFLQGRWAGLPNTRSDLYDKYENLYRYYLTFDRMLENLLLNGVLNKRTATRVLVHYNFLSKFSHCTSESIKIVSERKLHQLSKDGLNNVYDHYLSELALLYICYLLSMHLEHTIYYLTKWRHIKLKSERKLYSKLCKKVNDEFSYFWFIFNKPHQYDIFDYANRKCNYKKKILYRPEDIRLGDVRYYDDPLDRLKRLHQSSRELMTGNIYISPFHRDDA